jgi:ribosomal protein S18 acetylase RimI-like enzyme
MRRPGFRYAWRVISDYAIRLARPTDASSIARMSRDYVERGLGWSWTATRVLRHIRDRHTNVAVIQQGGNMLAFGIMHYEDETAHLLLLAVHPSRRRRGMAAAVLAWLEAVARTAGIAKVRVETRVGAEAARAFYRSRGYFELERVSGYYRGVEDALRLEKNLHTVLS